MDFTAILRKIEEALELAIGTEEEARLTQDLRLLKEWLARGQQGECPIDLRFYGFVPEEEKDSNISEQTAETLKPEPGKSVLAEASGAATETGELQIPPAGTEVAFAAEDSFQSVVLPLDQELPVGKTVKVLEGMQDRIGSALEQVLALAQEESGLISDDEEENARLALALEQQVLYRELERVREQIKAGHWREAVSLAKMIQERSQGEMYTIACDLLEQAQQGLQRTVAEILEKARQAREQNNLSGAADLYREVLALDPGQEQAKQALQEILASLNQQFLSQRWNALRAALKERRDIKRLSEAVYDAEALDAEGRLPEDLEALLKEAREAYDRIRLQMGEETTQMRFGDLEARKRAVDDLQARVAKGEKFVLDITLGIERPAAEVLREAQALLHQASEDTAQFELNYAEKNKAIRPRFVKRRLESALQKPFDEHHKRQLEGKLAEVERYIQAEEQAISLREQALQTTDQIQKLALLLQARQVFANLAGLDEQIEQVRLMALAVTQASVQDALNLAEVSLKSEDFRQTWEYLSEAELKINSWPEQEKPSEIRGLLLKAQELRSQLTAVELAWREYQSLADRIRQQVQDPNQRGAALALFQKVAEDERFKDFRDLRLLASEVEQYKSVQEQLLDAQAARQAGDWRRVYEIAERIMRSGQAGNLAEKFRQLYDEAVTELNIARAQDMLQNDDIFEANNILRKTLEEEKKRNPERAAILAQRLQAELERIDAAIQATKSGMQNLFDEGLRLIDFSDYLPFRAFINPSFALRQAKVVADGQVSNPEMRSLINRFKPEPEMPDPTPAELMDWLRPHLLEMLERKGIKERLDALRRFRYIGGDATYFQEGWPPLAVSLRTAEARRAARLLADSLRQSLLERIKKAYHAYIGKENELHDSELQQLAEWASKLRQANLLETEDERAVVRWAEIHWGMRSAQQAESLMNWQEAILIWQKLNDWYPGLPEIRRGLRQARIQHAINHAAILLHNHHKGEEALAFLQELRTEPEMENAWELNIMIAEVYSVLGNFESAFTNLDQAERIVRGSAYPNKEQYLQQIYERREQAESDRLVYLATIDAQSRARDHDFAEALRLLNAALRNPNLKNPSQILNLRTRLFNQGSAELLEKIHAELGKGSTESKVLVISYLLELQRLEELAELPQSERRSEAQLLHLRNDLKPAAESVIREVIDFDPSLLSLELSIRRASDLLMRLQTFENIQSIFTAELEPVRDSLRRRSVELGEVLKKLQDLKQVIDDVSKPERWQWAIKMGDFGWLELQRDNIRRLELQIVPEARVFERRLDETREIYEWLMKAIIEIKRAFIVNEDFDFVKRTVVETTALPDARQNGEHWQAINDKEYQEIRRMLSDRLRIPDIYGGEDLIGWETVQSQAEERAQELETWQNWERECARRLDQAAKALEIAQSYQEEPYRVRLKAWEKAREQVLQVFDILTYLDASKNERVVGIPNLSIRSQNSQRIVEEAKRRKVVAEEWLNQIEIEIAALQEILQNRGFPTEREFKDAVEAKDWDYLTKLLIRARQAGAVTKDEQKRVDIYTRVLNNELEKKKKRKIWSF